MARRSRRQAIVVSLIALALIVVAQGLIWNTEQRLNPGLVAATGLVSALLLGVLRNGPA